MSRIKISFKLPCPAFIESIIVYFVLRYRKKHYGFAFRRIKLIADKSVDKKYQYAIVDPQDYQKLTGCNWLFSENKSGNHYAVRLEGNHLVSMHRIIMNAPKGTIIDHKDNNGLNNTKSNLRFATLCQNNYNRRRLENCKSKYRGVSFHKPSKKWYAAIRYDGTRKFLGYFDNEIDAAKAYDAAAKIYHKDFASLNFP
ncbi:MAG: AP2 domain-containing protein [Phycisphaerae bacterium]|nr:AP2 domain-containing protein [Phycisphaerae bacterium]